MRRDRKETIIFIIILLVLSMGIGYAFLTTTLSIDGTSDIDSAIWDVHFENIDVDPYCIGGDQVITPATIGANSTSLSYQVYLKNPGDYYAFYVEAVNDGSLDAYVESISVKVNGVEDNIPSYIIPFVICEENSSLIMELQVGRILLAGTSDSYYVGVEYNRDVNIDELPTDNQSLTITFDITYSQYVQKKDFNNMYVYTVDFNNFVSGSSIPSNAVVYDDYRFALANFSGFQFIRHRIENNVITSSHLGFKHNNNLYYVEGGDGGSSYVSNKQVLQNAFGIDKCSESVEYYCDEPDCPDVNVYSCPNDSESERKVYVLSDGTVYAKIYRLSCSIDGVGNSRCRILPGQ